MMTLPPAHAGQERLRLLITGTVQGVGFRPFVHRHATRLGLAGWVTNAPAGVIIEAEGDPVALDELIAIVRQTPPPSARIAGIETRTMVPIGAAGFEIRESETGGAQTVEVPADLATCETCLREILDPADRRYRYPFTNCTDCGPRYSLIEALPYDRLRTTMRHFRMCEACRAEYYDPASRRFHAEPNACPVCGPRLALWDASGAVLAKGEVALLEAADTLRSGDILALKGLGGFQLLADACDSAAVRALRARKGRPDKPFAIMFAALADAEAACHISPAERALLLAPQQPIVLLRARRGTVAAEVAPGNPYLGVMLAYTPLHHLLLRELDFPVVATSGNRSGEPIAIDEHEAVERLQGVADRFLIHDRPIIRPVDDSVVRVVAGRALMLRRARGYAPAMPMSVSMRLLPGVLAVGGHLKATLAMSTAGSPVLSQHLGDLDTCQARDTYARTLGDLPRLYKTRPRLLVRDGHPDYHSTRTAEAYGLPTLTVQHHVAHTAACMAEHGLCGSALGVAWDGSGYGEDGTVWGGEFLHVSDTGYRRLAHLRQFRLPGGEQAVREPRRCAFGVLFALFGPDALAMSHLAPVTTFTAAQREIIRRMLERGINAPLTSSAGRLFDAVAALSGLRQWASYEGQAAAELEWAAEPSKGERAYAFLITRSELPWIVDWEPAVHALLADLADGVSVAAISAAFHHGLAAAITAVAMQAGEPRVVLSGGCFQNARLIETTVAKLQKAGFKPFWHSQIPPNDGGLALGQLAWAARELEKEDRPCV